jgi:large subunit ribosomal protein L34e
MPDKRIQLVGRHYATKSRRSVPIKTPGGKLVSQIITKKSKGPRCSDCKCALIGIKQMSNSAFKNSKKRERTVSRVYGGSACGNCVKTRIMRAFLLEEHKAVKKLMAEKKN